MCNLSQGIKEESFEEGKKQILIRMVTKMHESKFSLEQIAAIAEISVEKVREIVG